MKTRESSARWASWIGGSSKSRIPGGISTPALNDLEHRPATGAVRLPVEQRRLHVVPPAQRVEVELLVPVQRRLVAEPGPRRDTDRRRCRRRRGRSGPLMSGVSGSRSPPCSGWFGTPSNSCSVGPGGHQPRQLRDEMRREDRDVERRGRRRRRPTIERTTTAGGSSSSSRPTPR